MDKLKLTMLATLTLLALGALAAPGAYAVEKEEEGKPQILVLEGEAKSLEGELMGENPQLIQLNGLKTLKATKVALLFKNCLNLKENAKDTNLCNLVPLHITGFKQEEVACRSENNKGEKDPVETVLALLDMHVGAGKAFEGKELTPVIFAKILGTADEEELNYNCGLVKIRILGGTEKEPKGAAVMLCEFGPGLVNIPTTSNIEMLCKVNATTHDPQPPACEVLCTDFGPAGLFADLDGKNFKDAWWSMHLKGKLNKDVFIDD
jgi:hypothetical protein